MSFSHSIDDVVSYTPYDKIRFASSATKTGAKTQQGSAVTIEWDSLVTEINLASVTVGFAYARYYNSTTTNYSNYSPAVPVTGFVENSMRYIIDMVRLRTQETNEDLVSDDDLLKIAKECSDEIETVRKNWSFTQKSHNFDLTAGVQSYAVPSDLAGYESIASFYLGYDNTALTYLDLKEFRYKLRSFPRTITEATINSASTTISVADTTAFSTASTLAIGGDTAIAHTGKTVRTFTGVSGIVNEHTSNAEVFVTSDLDESSSYTIWNDHFMFYPPPEKFYNCNLDYYTTIPRMTDMTSETKVSMSSLYIWYLMSQVFRMKGKVSRANYYANKFGKMLKLLTKKNRLKQKFRMLPDKSYISRAEGYEDEILLERLHSGE